MREHDSKAVPEMATDFSKPSTFLLNELDMSCLEGVQWNAVYDALTMAITGISGIENQPRCERRPGVLNPAGEYLDMISEFLLNERVRLIECLNRHSPVEPRDKIRRANLLLQYEAECGELEMPEFAAFALSLANDRH